MEPRPSRIARSLRTGSRARTMMVQTVNLDIAVIMETSPSPSRHKTRFDREAFRRRLVGMPGEAGMAGAKYCVSPFSHDNATKKVRTRSLPVSCSRVYRGFAHDSTCRNSAKSSVSRPGFSCGILFEEEDFMSPGKCATFFNGLESGALLT